MYDLLLYHIPTSDSVTVLMECERAIANKLMLDIKKFKIRKKVSILCFLLSADFFQNQLFRNFFSRIPS